MPYYYRRPWRRWRRRRWIQRGWTRRPLRRRFYRNRRNWVRRKPFRKFKKIKITQYQPSRIRKCKVKGPISLFQTTNQRIGHNFDLYEISDVPEHLPGGGGWGMKLFTLEGLYSEHEYCRNIWTHTNRDLPLVRYMGCRIQLYQPEYCDYIFSYSNDTPMASNLGMYNAMQPSIHIMLPRKKIIPGTKTYRRHKPYKTLFIRPPTQLKNQWYFQQDMAKTPLLLTRTTATSLNKFYIDPNKINTNINITTINISVFQNRQFVQTGTETYWAKKVNEDKFYIYGYQSEIKGGKLQKKYLIPLTQTQTFEQGKSFADIHPSESEYKPNQWKNTWINNQGNPFYPDWLTNNYITVLIKKDPEQLFTETSTVIETYTPVELTHTFRYNTYADQGANNMVYFKSNKKQEINWLPPENPELYNDNLPFWILLWGFIDWHKRIKKHLHLDTDYICTFRHKTQKGWEYFVPISQSFLEGKSPYEPDDKPNKADADSWYPQLQYQEEIINNILLAGPGTVKIPDNFSVQGLMKYTFYFKWGGNPPPMDTISDPKLQPTYSVPGNKLTTNSLQNPTTYSPENILWSFDERRGYITQAAIRRLQKDKKAKTTSISDGNRFQDQPWTQETSPETSSEEEEEQATLYEQLQLQRHKQQQLRLRIIKTLQQLQNLE